LQWQLQQIKTHLRNLFSIIRKWKKRELFQLSITEIGTSIWP
jgi:hypothetical protein